MSDAIPGLELTLLVGTMTGTAELVAQEIELTFGDAENVLAVRAMDGLDAAVFVSGRLYLVVTSTYGQGDVPDNARMLYDSLQSTRPDLSGVRYGLIALGDRTYADTFCFGGRKFDALLDELGAERIGEIMCHDASSGSLPEDVALDWAAQWLAKARDRERERDRGRGRHRGAI